MNLTEFLDSTGFRSHGSVVNSWDAFRPDGTVLMQLWTAPGQRVRDHQLPGAYMVVRGFDVAHHTENKDRQGIGYAGRARAIAAIESGVRGFAAISSLPSEKHGAGEWAKYADLDKVYPILGTERNEGGDIFAVLGEPVRVKSLG